MDLSALAQLLDADIIDVVDIGANPIDDSPPYSPLLDAGLASVVGFEPNPDALLRLKTQQGENETYLPHAVYDGSPQTFHVCQAEGMSSLLEPNAELLACFHGFPEWGSVVSRAPIETVRLDDVDAIRSLDYLKIDIQGGELTVFENAVHHLESCLVIQTEVEFLPMYVDQPLFSDVERFLRAHGFVLHTFLPLKKRVLQPLVLNKDVFAGMNQLFWTDAVFIKDFTRFDRLSCAQLKKIALVLAGVYGSWDVALRAIMVHDQLAGDGVTPLTPSFVDACRDALVS